MDDLHVSGWPKCSRFLCVYEDSELFWCLMVFVCGWKDQMLGKRLRCVSERLELLAWCVSEHRELLAWRVRLFVGVWKEKMRANYIFVFLNI